MRDSASVGLRCGLRSQQIERDTPGDLESGNGILNPNELWLGPRLFCKLEKERGGGGRGGGSSVDIFEAQISSFC